MAKNSNSARQGRDLWPGTNMESVAQGWSRSVEDLIEQIRADFWVIPPFQTRTPNQVRAAFLIFALCALRQHAEMVRSHLRDNGDLKEAIKATDLLLPRLRTMRDVLDHMDDYRFGQGRQQRQAAYDNEPLAPVLALVGPDRKLKSVPGLDGYGVAMISSAGVWEFTLADALRCAQVLSVTIHTSHHRCQRCYGPGHRCLICHPLSDQEIALAFGGDE